jgi:hypothetical protein
MAKKVLPTLPRNAIGIALTFQTATDLTNSTDFKLVLKVGNTKIEKDLTESHITNPGTGEVRYITVEDDLGIVGKYKAQLIDTTAGVFLPSEIVEFEVIPNVE